MTLNDDAHEIIKMKNAFSQLDWNADIQETHSARDAIIALRRNHWTTTPADLVMCSSRLDGESILYFLGILRAHPNINHQPIIVFSTGRVDTYIIKSCRTLGVLEYYSVSEEEISFTLMLNEVKSHFNESGRLISNVTWCHRMGKSATVALDSGDLGTITQGSSKSRL